MRQQPLIMELTQEQSLITGYMQAPDFMGMMQETPKIMESLQEAP